MILIICHKNDKSTDEIINWLHFFNQKFFRCDFKGFIQNFILKSVVPNNGVQSSQIFSKRDNCEVKSIWYRREAVQRVVQRLHQVGLRHHPHIRGDEYAVQKTRHQGR